MTTPESIDDYLDDLAGKLNGSNQQSRRFLLEVEAHLNDERDSRLGRGEDVAHAEAEAIRLFGTAADVAREANRASWRESRDRSRSQRSALVCASWLSA